MDLSDAQTGQQARTLLLADLLGNVFDAADESDEGQLTHKEVADLLYATLSTHEFKMPVWDIQLLLAGAEELDTGVIEYKPFVVRAPEVVEDLRTRRQRYLEHNKPVEVTLEAA